MAACNWPHRSSEFAPTRKGADAAVTGPHLRFNKGLLVSDRLGYGSAPFAPAMR